MIRKMLFAITAAVILGVLVFAQSSASAGRLQIMTAEEMANTRGACPSDPCCLSNVNQCTFSSGTTCQVAYDEDGNPMGCTAATAGKATGTYSPPYTGASQDALGLAVGTSASLHSEWKCLYIKTKYCRTYGTNCVASSGKVNRWAGWKTVCTGNACP